MAQKVIHGFVAVVKWEYKISQRRSIIPEGVINEFGAEGWELTAAYKEITSRFPYHYYFKRQIPATLTVDLPEEGQSDE